MTDHNFTCSCGEAFDDTDKLDRHVFEKRAQAWFAEHLGEPFTSYHANLTGSMGCTTAYDTAVEMGIGVPSPENVQRACLAFARTALAPPNDTDILDLTGDDDEESTKTVNIEVYGDDDAESGVYGVLTEHRADLPEPFDDQLQAWVAENFRNFIDGDGVFHAGEMEYEPNGDIVEFRKKI